MTDLFKIVQLFRTSKGANFDGYLISGSASFSNDIHELFIKYLKGSLSSGRFDELEIDGRSIEDLDELPSSWSTCNYTFLLNQSNSNKFYKSSTDFIHASCLSKGSFPTEYYIASDDFYSGESKKPDFIYKLENILSLINSLAQIAHYHDIKNEGGNSFYRLVFVMNSESKSTSAVIETKLEHSILGANKVESHLIKNIIAINPMADAHYDEKINTFRNTLIEYITQNHPTFTQLVFDWDSINKLYSDNLAVYMSAFSFHKARKEIADAEIDFAEKISKTLLELSNKVLAIPISFVGALALLKLVEKSEILLTLLGVILTSIIMHLVIVSQKKQFERVIHAKDVVFSSLLKKLEGEDKNLVDNSELKARITEAIQQLLLNEQFCNKVLNFLLSVTWMPTSVGIAITIYKLII
ncbi:MULTISPECIES: hypothetical protein [Cronobacter]|uniref:hypothetical protein n=1 Tax=Cronobacter TaxID=413496 RepID=UPI000BE8ED68|nr:MULTISPECIES: hypothetical protein [Cronobacter]ELY3796820.1 hypothetical protein [Cronobacter sakazakii]ELY3830397.1 hypothetical protein [Cronobacter sakazakii]ELY4145622.1 hypothetical protein [Cronobacter sakazakii]MDT3581400.1 hypothetical protein [Cronobacter malonaticus]PUV45065.1 hypothetical protein CDU02_02960 [Cronobacter sakazakii]